MIVYILKRLLQAVSVLAIVSVITFVIIHSAPGGPEVLLSEHLTLEDREIISRRLGLEDPLPVQYFKWLGSLLRFDFGTSFTEGMPVLDLLASSLCAYRQGLLLDFWCLWAGIPAWVMLWLTEIRVGL